MNFYILFKTFRNNVKNFNVSKINVIFTFLVDNFYEKIFDSHIIFRKFQTVYDT